MEVPDGVVRVSLRLLVRLVTVEALDALVRLVVKLAVDRLPLTVDQLEGVGAVSREASSPDSHLSSISLSISYPFMNL